MEKFVLYRYMPKQYCEKMVNDGEVRISRSSKFKDGAGMTEGQKDDEHYKSLVVHASGIRMKEDDRLDQRVNSEIVKLNANDDKYKIGTTLNVPYWVLCLSVDLRLDLFDEFNSDAVVVIWDSNELIQRMIKSSKFLVPSPEFKMKMFYQPVHYLGELIVFGRMGLMISPFFTKPDRYKSQKEYRVVWYPCYSDELHVYLQLGSLKDIAEVVLSDDWKRVLSEKGSSTKATSMRLPKKASRITSDLAQFDFSLSLFCKVEQLHHSTNSSGPFVLSVTQ